MANADLIHDAMQYDRRSDTSATPCGIKADGRTYVRVAYSDFNRVTCPRCVAARLERLLAQQKSSQQNAEALAAELAAMGARRVTFTATVPVGSRDCGAETDIEVTAMVMPEDVAPETAHAVTFIEPSLRDLQAFHGDSTIDLLIEQAIYIAAQADKRSGELTQELFSIARAAGGAA